MLSAHSLVPSHHRRNVSYLTSRASSVISPKAAIPAASRWGFDELKSTQQRQYMNRSGMANPSWPVRSPRSSGQ